MTDDDDRCRRCGRPLHSPLALAAGYGATCALRALGDRPRRSPRIPENQLALDDSREDQVA